ncbi:MAG: sodium/solute symporter [Myxococcales bacterium]|nr:sodium/solute symporter [Myxococcales bacterium]
MTPLDWTVIVAYLGAMVALSAFIGTRQRSQEDYYVGGRTIPWWAIGISTMATQTSANSFLGIPAFVALSPGGGLTWLQYEMAVPLAMLVAMATLSPTFRRLELISIYEYLERRFDRPTRLVMAGVFLLSRGLATGIGIYAAALVVQVCIGSPLWFCILLVGGITVVYDTIGGMTAVVYSDVVQLVILLLGIILCIALASSMSMDWTEMLRAHAPERLDALDMGHGLGDRARTPFWGFLVGGFVLYISYYGVDQSQAQRQLSAPTLREAKRSLVFNGFARFPLTLLYLVLGLAIGAVYHRDPDLRAAVPAEHLDYLVPAFVQRFVPSGLRGLLFAGIFAAAMSSLDSALNSLSATTMRDFVEPRIAPHRRLVASRITTVLWGAIITAFAFWVGNISSTVVEGINKLGAFFYGPLLAAFLAGILDRRARGPAVLVGVLLGVLTNALLFILFPDTVHWMWWNCAGLATAMVTTFLGSRAMAAPLPASLQGTTLTWAQIRKDEGPFRATHLALIAYFLGIVVIAAFLGPLLRFFAA